MIITLLKFICIIFIIIIVFKLLIRIYKFISNYNLIILASTLISASLLFIFYQFNIANNSTAKSATTQLVHIYYSYYYECYNNGIYYIFSIIQFIKINIVFLYYISIKNLFSTFLCCIMVPQLMICYKFIKNKYIARQELKTFMRVIFLHEITFHVPIPFKFFYDSNLCLAEIIIEYLNEFYNFNINTCYVSKIPIAKIKNIKEIINFVPIVNNNITINDNLNINFFVNKKINHIFSWADDKPHNYLLFHSDNSIKYIDDFIINAINYVTEKKNKQNNTQLAQLFLINGQKASTVPDVFKFDYVTTKFTRPLNTIFIPEIDKIIECVSSFKNKTGRFGKHMLPYKLGFLLYGYPGCGKTSTIKAIAREMQRHIIEINLKMIKTTTQLAHLFNVKFIVNDHSTRKDVFTNLRREQIIYVLEDIDCLDDVVLDRNIKKCINISDKNIQTDDQFNIYNDGMMCTELNNNVVVPKEKNTDELTLSSLLNILDGINDQSNRVIIATTNHIENLDKALIRPGRFDIKIHFKKMTRISVIKMVEYLYDTTNISSITIDDYVMSPAELEGLCLEYIDVNELIDAINKYVPNSTF